MLCCLSACLGAAAQAEMDRFVRHYSGYYLSEGSAGKAQLQRVDKTVKYHLKRSWRNYYNIIIENDGGDRYLTLTGDRELVFADGKFRFSHRAGRGWIFAVEMPRQR